MGCSLVAQRRKGQNVGKRGANGGRQRGVNVFWVLCAWRVPFLLRRSIKMVMRSATSKRTPTKTQQQPQNRVFTRKGHKWLCLAVCETTWCRQSPTMRWCWCSPPRFEPRHVSHINNTDISPGDELGSALGWWHLLFTRQHPHRDPPTHCSPVIVFNVRLGYHLMLILIYSHVCLCLRISSRHILGAGSCFGPAIIHSKAEWSVEWRCYASRGICFEVQWLGMRRFIDTAWFADEGSWQNSRLIDKQNVCEPAVLKGYVYFQIYV